jgi:hypothetical protein
LLNRPVPSHAKFTQTDAHLKASASEIAARKTAAKDYEVNDGGN